MLHSKTIALLLGLLMGSVFLASLLAGSLFIASYSMATTSRAIKQLYPSPGHAATGKMIPESHKLYTLSKTMSGSVVFLD